MELSLRSIYLDLRQIDSKLMALFDNIWTFMALAGAGVWLGILLLPWQPFRTRESLDCRKQLSDSHDMQSLTVLIPARNESQFIRGTLKSLMAQSIDITIIVINDRSDDGTGEIARRTFLGKEKCIVIDGEPLPAGWTGKVWALHQGLKLVKTPLVLLLDADVKLKKGLLSQLLSDKNEKGVALISLMVRLDMSGFWQAMLIPAFIYFFKLLYPFHLSNGSGQLVSAGAGGCILTESQLLNDIGGFESIRDAIIDDCSLVRAVKRTGVRTWIGLTHSAESMRVYRSIGGIWGMVVRSAYTQLRSSVVLLLLCTGIFILAFFVPTIILAGVPVLSAKVIAVLAIIFMVFSYFPTLRYYEMSPLLALTMPLVGILYLTMTWHSAINHWRGRGSLWKGRVYVASTDPIR